MSGHSHYHNIAAKKAKTDAAKGKTFPRLSKEITITVKQKGKDPDTNPALRTLIEKAKDSKMPQDNINRAIAKGSGELGADEQYIESSYETVKNGVSIVVKTLSTNNNRVVAKINEIFKRNGVILAKSGSASRNFQKLGIIYVKNASDFNEDALINDVLELGADDIDIQQDFSIVKCRPSMFDAILNCLQKKYDIDRQESSVCLYPIATVDTDDKTCESVNKLIDMLEEFEDVQEVYHNMK